MSIICFKIFITGDEIETFCFGGREDRDCFDVLKFDVRERKRMRDYMNFQKIIEKSEKKKILDWRRK